MLIQDLGIEPYALQPNEDYMNERQTRHFKTLLHAWKDRILKEIDEIKNLIKLSNQAQADVNDIASNEEYLSRLLRKGDRGRKLLKRIATIIDDLEEGNYGHCQSCGCDIGIRRLEARPVANKCFDCKSIEEDEEHLAS